MTRLVMSRRYAGASTQFQPRSVLGHDGLAAAQLALDLLASPASRVNGSGLELSVGLCLLNHGGEPLLAESLDKLPIGIGIGKVTE